MPIKKDDSGKRWVEMEFLTPGTPEQVWQAMATGPGNAAWFMRAEIEEREGGRFRFDFGQEVSTNGEVTLWQPPHRFGYVERDWMENAPPVATEISIVARSGGLCQVRMVHSLFASGDDWDDQLEGFESGWPCFFAALRLYLEYFPGLPGAGFMAMVPTTLSTLESWRDLLSATGLDNPLVGEERAGPAGPETLAGVIEKVVQEKGQRYLVLRLSEPGPGIMMCGVYQRSDHVSVSVVRFAYGNDAAERAASLEGHWRDWMAQRFPAPAAT
ncbi:SRPBCC family protein [Niveispirillum fermenti]|uniref:SRPBCC family protein n=1 Tax=Niveispirillum fermenti TaxID=1233113 RepID=UPI003A8C2808